MVRQCIIKNCKSLQKDIHMHILPKDSQLFKQWTLAIGRDFDIEKRASYRVCDKHFANDMKFQMNRNRSNLKLRAVPTLFLPEPPDEAKIPQTKPTELKTFHITNTTAATAPIDHQYARPQIIDFTASAPFEIIEPPSPPCPIDDDDDVEEVPIFRVCRLCLTNEHVTDISMEGFKTYDYDNIEEPNNVVDILKKYTHIEFSDPTLKSMSVCKSCHKMLQSIQLFANMCRKAEKCLTTIDQHKVSIEMNPLTEAPDLQEKSDALYNNLETKFSNILSIQMSLNLVVEEKEVPTEPTIETVPVKDDNIEIVSATKVDTIKTIIVVNKPPPVVVDKPTQPVEIDDHSLCEICGCKLAKLAFRGHQLGCRENKDIVVATMTRMHHCIYCDNVFYTERAREMHVKQHHWNFELLCEICGDEMIAWKLHGHIKAHSRVWLCYICGEQFPNRVYHHKHVKRHKISIKMVKNCKVCKMPVIDMTEHRIKYHPKVKKWLKCTICNIICSNMTSYEKHKKSHEEVIVHLCNICGQGFEREALLNNHALTHGIAKKYSCHICKEEYEDWVELQEHKEVHKVHACTTCDQKFMTDLKLRIHVELEHLQNFKCETCGKCFRLKRLLNEHVPIHSGIYPFKCHICDKGFSFVQSVNAHIQNVHNSGLQCKHCNKVCTSKTMYYHHQMSHAGLKPFVCQMCTKGFQSQRMLQEHRLTHSGQTAYKCPKCGLAIVHRRTLKLHLNKCNSEITRKVVVQRRRK